MGRFDGKIALVTGSSSGIGAGTAYDMAAEGADIIIHYNSGKERAEKMVEKIKALGLVATPMVADLMASPEFMHSINGTPAGRIAQVDDLSKLIRFLASDDAEYIHGEAILIDGGLVAGGGHNFKD